MNQEQRNEIEQLTQQYGGDWGINHTRRLLKLIEIIGEGLGYDTEVTWLAAHLHDWGAYAPWAQAGVDHALRSRQVAQTFLSEHDFPEGQSEAVLECIAFHHQVGAERRLEAILLRDADALDFLGVVGVLRDFAKKPKDLRKGYEATCQRKEQLRQAVTLEKAREMADERIHEMEGVLAHFEVETFGLF